MRNAWTNIWLGILALNTTWFVIYSLDLGFRAATTDAPQIVSRIFKVDAVMANALMSAHMMAGAVLTIGAPIQAMPVVRKKWRHAHRRLGYALTICATTAGVCGLSYIGFEGTIGGWWMSFWFSVYGLATILAAANTVYYARAKDMQRHAAWATRLVVLAVGSWIYRMHYVIWYTATDGRGSRSDFTGPFDLIQVFAFFVPYLLIAELFLRRHASYRFNG